MACGRSDFLPHRRQATTKFIKPVLLAVMGLAVGGMAMLVFLPIFSINKILLAS